ncbi:MAG TPA: hypothetical protein VHK70_08575 [Burkholderiaceae bacterium]|nr:hypothetical protein [Burkholderiaceae bacterium]
MENGFVSEEQISSILARQLSIFYINPDTVRLLPETRQHRFRAIALEGSATALVVGLAEPSDLFVR